MQDILTLQKHLQTRRGDSGQYFDEIWHNDADIKSTLDSMADQLNGLLAQ